MCREDSDQTVNVQADLNLHELACSKVHFLTLWLVSISLIGPEKRSYLVIMFLISPQKHNLCNIGESPLHHM